jgi:hypothetical protein
MIVIALVAALVPNGYDSHRTGVLSDVILFQLATDKQTYVVGEPIEFRLSGKNRSDSVFHALLAIAPSRPETQIRVRRGDETGRVLSFFSGGGAGDLAALAPKLQPGESFVTRQRFVFDYATESFILDQPGTYEFKAIYRPADPNWVLESNAVVVRVEPSPENKRDAFEAYKKVRSMVPMERLDVRAISEREVLAAFDFLDEFPDSPWSSDVRSGIVRVVQYRVGHRLASPEEEQRFGLLMGRERAGRTEGH